jgi:hypothetical protein
MNYHKNYRTYYELSQELRDIWKICYKFISLGFMFATLHYN